MDDAILGLLWVCAVSGALALLGLVAELVERGAEAFDEWLDSICTGYVDD